MAELSEGHIEKYLRGEVELRELARLSAEQVQQLRKRAQMFIDGGHDERALVMLEMLEELDRKDTTAAIKAIDTLLALGKSGEAMTKVQRLLALEPKSYDGRLARAKVEIATGQWALAATTLQQLVKEDPTAQTEAGKRAHALARQAHGLFEASR
ncbi:MAG TPA: tetratricopeptide repeat protein [Myxococcota bacterium]|nr:tetratricopeptide repeat protein [Myxococcota bacterium]